jgi:hypothetical protein
VAADPFIALKPSDGVVVFRGYIRPGSKLLQERHAPLEKPLYFSLWDVTEVHFVTLENNLTNFYTNELVAPKSSVVICFSMPKADGRTTINLKQSLLFAAGCDCPQYVQTKTQIDAFLTEQLRRHAWEHVSIFRPAR